jgi:hypothetical protein
VTRALPPLSADEARELRELVYRLCHDDTVGAISERIEALVSERADGRMAYAKFVDLIVGLHWRFAAEGDVRTVVGASPVTITSFPRGLRFTPQLFALAASLLLVGYFVALGGLLIWDRIHPRDLHQTLAVQSPSSQFAKLVRAENCQWGTNLPRATVGEWLAGHEIELRTGIAELQFADGAMVTLEGPAKFEPQAANRAFLRVGKLVATVRKEAIGFTVETPTATVVDLGTEFGVETDEHGATEVQVIRGKIELRPSGRISDSSRVQQPITLSAGEARRIEPTQTGGTPVVREIAATPDRLVRQIGSTESRRIVVGGALASSTYSESDFGVNLIINGSGLTRGAHSTNPQGTMWFSELGKTAGEYLLFDLARPRRLNSMKVWNLNEAWQDMYRFRGVKLGSIYVSTSGKGNPIDQPNEWQLVVEHHHFEMATGKSDYATPDVIPLDDREARFVAMVIESTFGTDPRPGFSDKTAVGLSEVQFFGQPLLAKENKK